MGEGGRRPLNRRRVLEAALGLADREGLEALSMRRLGRELGVEAMSLYNHVPNKEALLDGMVEVLLARMKVSLDSEEGWEENVRRVFRSFRLLALAHPDVFTLFAVRPNNTSKVVWLLPVFLDALRGAGFDVMTSLRVFRVLSSYTIGYALAEIRGFSPEPEASRPVIPGLDGEEERIFEMAPLLEGADGDAEFEFGLDLILNGLKST
jgi:TetR/AcrR family tetracycline transcriptional repressor